MFDVQVGAQAVTNYDILSETGPNSAISLKFFEFVDEGNLVITLKLNAIEVVMDLPHVAHDVSQGPYFGTDVSFTITLMYK